MSGPSDRHAVASQASLIRRVAHNVIPVGARSLIARARTLAREGFRWVRFVGRAIGNRELVDTALRLRTFTSRAIADRHFVQLVLEHRDFVATQLSYRQSASQPAPLRSGRVQSHAAWVAKNGDKTLRQDYDLMPQSLVVDVGGFEGQWASDIYSRYQCHIEIFEPVRHYAGFIRSRFANNSRIVVHARGLGAATSHARIQVTGDASSMIAAGSDAADVEVISFVDWHRDAGSPEIDLLKINIEGFEYDLLDHIIESGLISRIANLQVQFHDFVPDSERRMRAIVDKLRATHLPTYRFFYVWENWQRKAKGDGHRLRLAYTNLKLEDGSLDPDFVRELVEALQIKVFIETGTYRGDTLASVMKDFETLVSIELDVALHTAALQRFAERNEVHLLQGDSATLLQRAFDISAGRAALIWLDAHYSGPGTSRADDNTPVLKEIETVLQRASPRDVVMVDDLRCFTAPLPGFDSEFALGGYPEAAEIATLFQARGYQVYVLCDALVAIPPALHDVVTTTPVLEACTRLRLWPLNDADRSAAERTISEATGTEARALAELPPFLTLHKAYGLGADYFYWRSLVGERLGLETTAADRAFARKCGVPRRQ